MTFPRIMLFHLLHQLDICVMELTVQELKRTDSLENLLTCPICLDITFEPVTSSCNHHFCKACLKRLLQYEGRF